MTEIRPAEEVALTALPGYSDARRYNKVTRQGKMPRRAPWVIFFSSKWQNQEVDGGSRGYACKYAPMRIWNNRP